MKKVVNFFIPVFSESLIFYTSLVTEHHKNERIFFLTPGVRRVTGSQSDGEA
jgi:hypothetical protein